MGRNAAVPPRLFPPSKEVPVPIPRQLPSFGRRSLTALHVSLVIMTGVFIAVLLVVAMPGGKQLVEEHFSLLRATTYVAWGAGILAYALAPLLLAEDLGATSPVNLRRLGAVLEDVGGRKLARAFTIGAAGNFLVLVVSPLGAVLGEVYSWNIFRAHLLLSMLVVVLASAGALVRVRAVLGELAHVPAPKRASHAEPASF
jgi:hypothetical protein